MPLVQPAHVCMLLSCQGLLGPACRTKTTTEEISAVITCWKNQQRVLARQGRLNRLELVVPELFMVEVASESCKQLLVW